MGLVAKPLVRLLSSNRERSVPTDIIHKTRPDPFARAPFGETLRATGAYAATNNFRFSTKYTDTETQLIYFGYRYYSPGLGRWFGRDPLAEKGGLHLYAFGRNNSINGYDYLGADWKDLVDQAFDYIRNLPGAIVGWIWNPATGTYYTPEDDYDNTDSYRSDSLFNAEVNRAANLALNPPTQFPIISIAGISLNTVTIVKSTPAQNVSTLSQENSQRNTLIKKLRLVPDAAKTHLTVQPYDRSAKAQEMAKTVNDLIDKLRNLKTVMDDGLTQAALYLRRLESSGLANSIFVVGTYSSDPTSRAEARTDQDGAFSRITLDANNQDSLAALAHEIVHAFQNLVGAAVPGTPFDEMEPVAVENEVLAAMGLGNKIGGLHSGVEIPTWNKYVPWYTIPPTRNGGGAQ